MKRAVEFRAETRRLRRAFSRLTEPSPNRPSSFEKPAIARNIDHYRLMLARGIHDEANRQLIETLLRYMESAIADRSSVPQSQDNAASRALQSDERRLKIVAREILKGQGLTTVSYLRELADIAKNTEDEASAEAWHELAEAAERIIYRLSRGGQRA
jgi:hypothetical protein